jgi:hypothetical protein
MTFVYNISKKPIWQEITKNSSRGGAEHAEMTIKSIAFLANLHYNGILGEYKWQVEY